MYQITRITIAVVFALAFTALNATSAQADTTSEPDSSEPGPTLVQNLDQLMTSWNAYIADVRIRRDHPENMSRRQLRQSRRVFEDVIDSQLELIQEVIEADPGPARDELTSITVATLSEELIFAATGLVNEMHGINQPKGFGDAAVTFEAFMDDVRSHISTLARSLTPEAGFTATEDDLDLIDETRVELAVLQSLHADLHEEHLRVCSDPTSDVESWTRYSSHVDRELTRAIEDYNELVYAIDELPLIDPTPAPETPPPAVSTPTEPTERSMVETVDASESIDIAGVIIAVAVDQGVQRASSHIPSSPAQAIAPPPVESETARPIPATENSEADTIPMPEWVVYAGASTLFASFIGLLVLAFLLARTRGVRFELAAQLFNMTSEIELQGKTIKFLKGLDPFRQALKAENLLAERKTLLSVIATQSESIGRQGRMFDEKAEELVEAQGRIQLLKESMQGMQRELNRRSSRATKRTADHKAVGNASPSTTADFPVVRPLEDD